MLEVLERSGGAGNDLVRGYVVQASDHPHAARIVLIARVVESNGL
jgi:hypothetical protein